MIQKEEKEIVAELKQEQKDQQVVEQETEELIAKLEQQQQQLSSSENKESLSPTTSTTTQDKESTTQKLLDKLEQDEEKVQAETLQLIEKVEKLEADAERYNVSVLPETAPSTNNQDRRQQQSPPPQNETEEFLAALKERSEENKDLIAVLQEKSKRYYNEKTGRYNTMSQGEFLQRKDEYMKRENAAVELWNRYREEWDAGKELLLQPDGVLDKLGKRAKAEQQAVETFLSEQEELADLMETLRARVKATDEFTSLYNTFLEKLQSRLGMDTGH